jgi:hypothetical protein
VCVCLFVCLYPPEQFFSYPAAVTINGDRAANLGRCSALRAFEQGGIFIVLHLLRHGTSVQKTGTHVPQWDSIPRLKDHQIFETDALTTAPRGRLHFVIHFVIHFKLKIVEILTYFFLYVTNLE